MNFIKKIDRYHKINQLIQQQCTGNPQEFAAKLSVSRSHLYRLLNIMKDYGASIEYSRKHQSFYYTNFFKLCDMLSANALSIEQIEDIKGV